MKSISAVELDMVTGGKLDASLGTGRPAGTSLTSSGASDQVLATLRGIRSSLKDAKPQGIFNGPAGAMCMAAICASAMRPPAASSSQVVYYGGGGYHGPSFRARFAWG